MNSVGQALATQLELDALIELVGERIRETFEADIAYVALHDEAAGQIDFVYYYESGRATARAADPVRRRAHVADPRGARAAPAQPAGGLRGQGLVGTPSMSYLGVPIFAGDKAIGVISVQSIREEGRFVEADARLLDTIASNVGGAIQNARLFAEVERQREHFESLVEISPVAVVVMDAEERVTGWNPAAAELFGHTRGRGGRPPDRRARLRRRHPATRGGTSRARRSRTDGRTGSRGGGARTGRRSTSSSCSSR